MAGSRPKYRHLSRNSAHRKALLRNLVTSLFEHGSITTTWHKAKEAQRLAERAVTLGKRNTVASRSQAQAIFFRPHLILPRLFGEIRERYANRPGGYTRVTLLEPRKEDQARSAILELVDNPYDMKFAMVARTIARQQHQNLEMNDITVMNIKKVTQFRPDGEDELESLVGRFRKLFEEGDKGVQEVKKKKVYPYMPVQLT